MITIGPCDTNEDFATADRLMAELGVWDSAETEKLGFDAQSVLEFYYPAGGSLPGADAPRLGKTLLGYVDGVVGGCIAYRELAPGICELKRLYVRPRFRRTGLGRALLSELLAHARAAHLMHMRLETVSFMAAAVNMYEAMGFVRRPPYYNIPEEFLPITIFMEKDLAVPEAGLGGGGQTVTEA